MANSRKDAVLCAAGRTLWWEFCTPINTVLLYARNEIDKVGKDPRAQHHNGKKYLNKAIAEVDRYITRLRHSGDYKVYNMFTLDGKPEEEQRWYREDVTSEEMYEYWRTIGCEGYIDVLPFYTTLENKIRQMIIKHAPGYEDASAGLVCVSYLCSAFNFVLKASTHQLKVQSRVDVTNDFAHYSMLPLLHMCDRLGAAVYGPSKIMFDEVVEANIAFGLRDVMDRWSDYILPLRNAMIVTPEFLSLFKSKGFMMKQVDDYGKMIEEIEVETKKHKLVKIKEKLKNEKS